MTTSTHRPPATVTCSSARSGTTLCPFVHRLPAARTERVATVHRRSGTSKLSQQCGCCAIGGQGSLSGFLIGSITFYSIHVYNTAQGEYATGHRTTLTLLNKQSISGVQIGFEGRNYIMLVGNTKEEIDASLVGPFNPEVARSATGESLNRKAQAPTRAVPQHPPRPAPKLLRAIGRTDAKGP